MVDPVATRVWGYRALFAGLVSALALMRLMPIDVAPVGLPGPDLILALTFAWVLRRPAYVPAWLIVALFVPLDLVLMAPPGLGALAVLVATEILRRRQAQTHALQFPMEWALVTAVLLAMVAGTQAVLGLSLAPRPPLGLDLLRAMFTAAIYPLAVVASLHLFKVRRPTPSDVEAYG